MENTEHGGTSSPAALRSCPVPPPSLLARVDTTHQHLANWAARLPLEAERRELAGLLWVCYTPAQHHRQRPGPPRTTR